MPGRSARADTSTSGLRLLTLRHGLLIATALAGVQLACREARAQAASSGLAPAQPAATQAAAKEAHTKPQAVEEVVVTSQRRSERLQDVPIAVTAVTAQQLARAHIDNISRLQILTPGFTWGQQGSDSFPAIRGVRTSLVSAQNDPVIGFFIDGVYQSRTEQQSIPLFDISRVEVQRGPQGTLYGRNTFGGNLSVVTNTPTSVLSSAVNVEYGNYNQVRADGYVNIPLASTLDLRVAVVHMSHDGYVHSSTTPDVSLADDDENAERISLRWTPTSQLQVDVHGGLWERQDAGAGSYGYKTAGTLINPVTGYQSVNGVPFAVNPSVHNGTDLVHGVDIGIPVTGGPYTNDWNYQPFEHIVEDYISDTISYDLGPVIVRSISGYTAFRAHRSADNDQSSEIFEAPSAGFGSGVQEPDDRAKTASEELQVASKATVPLQWIVGAFYLHDDVHETYQQDITAPGSNVDGYKETTALETNAFAGYGQASYFLLPHLLRAIAGIRYSVESKRFGFADYDNGTPGTLNFDGAPYSVTSGEPWFHSITWRAGLELTPTRQSMYYATVSTGFESGGVNDTGGSTAIPSSYAPQTVTAYEIGAKNRFLNGKVQTEVSLFYNNFKDLQINVYTPQVSYFGSAGQANSKGAEFTLRTLPFDNFHIDGTVSYLDAVYTRYISSNNFYGQSNGEDPVSVDLSGKVIPMSPRYKTTLAAYYDFDLGRYGTLSPYASWLFSSKYYTTDYNTPLDKQGDYSLFDLSLRWTSASTKYYVEGFGTNVTNRAVLLSGVVGRDARVQVSYGPPAFYGARAGVKF